MGRVKGSYVVVHSCSTEEIDTRIIRPLNMVELGAVPVHAGPVVERVVVRHESDGMRPVPHFCCPVSIRLVPCVPGQSGGKVEEASV
jgi:hypothetical protein